MNRLEEKRKAMMGEIDYGLPKGYMALEYLQSATQKEWIDTGIKGSYKITVEGEWYVDVSTITDDYVIFYQGENAVINRSHGLLRLKDGSWMFTSGSARKEFSNPSTTPIRFTAKTTGKKCIINGVSCATHDPDNFTSNRNIFIFGTSSTTRIRSNKGDTGVKRIYWCKMYEDSNLVRDFQPCFDTARTPCLYDRVSKQTFYNKGSGNFTYGLL